LVTDLKMPELDGMQVLEQVKQRWPETKRKTSGRSCRWMKPS
jgi:CheY-like chemotaxis protein